MRIVSIVVLILLSFSSCIRERVLPTKACETEVQYWGIQCETQLPLVKFEDGSFGEVTNMAAFPDYFSRTEPPEFGSSLTIGWEYDEDTSTLPLPFIICNVARTPAEYITVLCLEEAAP